MSRHTSSYTKINTISETANYLSLLTENTSKAAKESAILYFRQAFSSEEQNAEISDYSKLISSLLEYIEGESLELCSDGGNELRLVDAAWILTNLACISNDMCHLIVEQNAVATLFELALVSPRGSQLRAQALWAVGNVAADCSDCKQKCRDNPILELIGDILLSKEYGKEVKVVRNIVWCALNIVRGGITNLPIMVVVELVKGFHQTMIMFPSSPFIIKDCLWAIAALADDMNTGRQIEVITSQEQLIDHIVILFNKNDLTYMHGCLRILGNIATGNDRQTEVVLSHPQFYNTILKALKSPLRYLSREAAWICSNVAAGNVNHVDCLFEDNQIFKHIMRGAADDANDNKMQKECLWTLANMLTAASPERNSYLVAAGIITIFPFLLNSNDIRIVERSIACLRSIITDHPHYIGYVIKTKMIENINESFLQLDINLKASKENVLLLMKDYLTKNNVKPYTFQILRN